MKIELNIGRHCIETAAKLKNEHLIRACLKHPAPEIEEQITGLTCFLEHADFQILRTVIGKLGHKASSAELEWNKGLRPTRLRVNGQPVSIQWKS